MNLFGNRFCQRGQSVGIGLEKLHRPHGEQADVKAKKTDSDQRDPFLSPQVDSCQGAILVVEACAIAPEEQSLNDA